LIHGSRKSEALPLRVREKQGIYQKYHRAEVPPLATGGEIIRR
jgi:hypothetical protein